MEAGKKRRMYPIIGTYPKEYIPWDMLTPHEAQALRNHNQTLERLAERGGLAWIEVISILEDKPWSKTPMLPSDEARRIVLERVAAWEAEQNKEKG